MTKLLPFKWIKSSEFETVQQEIASLQAQIATATELVKEIANGNLEFSTQTAALAQHSESLLSKALLELSDQLKKLSEEEKQRNWVTESRAKFIDILRSRNEDMRELSENIISNLVKTMRANQGALYLVNDDNAEDIYIEMAACYAYNRKKHLNQRIELGAGLVGQTFLEKASIYMTDIPTNYLRITSGLGDSLPRNLLIVPLKLEENVFGVVEIASFETIKKYEIEFLEQLGESIASTISIAKINQRTKKLLHESQAQTEQMRSQEEEMRQNLEELSATQEEIHRVLKEAQGKEQYLNELINVSKDSIVAIDRNYQIISYNTELEKSISATGVQLEKGSDYLGVYPAKDRANQKALFDRAFAGEDFELVQEFHDFGTEMYFLFNYSPLHNEQGEIIAIAVFAKNITEMTIARRQAEHSMKEAQQQAEEMKAQEEELRQNMEELQATQEEMQRLMQDAQDKETYLHELMDATNDTILTFDRQYNLVTFNKTMRQSYTAQGLAVEKGTSLQQVIGPDQWPTFQSHYDRVLAGETFQLTEHYQMGEFDSYFLISYSPLKDQAGVVTGGAVFARDVTDETLAKQQAEKWMQESQQRTEELKAQEEELRQNLEELSASQEEMQRIVTEMQNKDQYTSELLNVSTDSIVTLDKNFRMISCNQVCQATFASKGITVGKGFDMLGIFPPEVKNKKIALYKRIFAGESFEEIEHLNNNGFDNYFLVKHSPLRNPQGEIIALAIYAKDVTELTNARK